MRTRGAKQVHVVEFSRTTYIATFPWCLIKLDPGPNNSTQVSVQKRHQKPCYRFPHSAQPREPLRRMPTHQPPRVLTDSILQVARVFSGCASQCERSKWLRQRWHVAAEHHH